MNTQLKTQPTVFVIFGGTGDLNARKLAPALYNLYLEGWLPEHFAFIGTGRTKLTDEAFRERMLNDINEFSRSGKVTDEQWQGFEPNIYYQAADVQDAKTYKDFGKKIKALEADWKTPANVLYYLAVAPNFFPIIAENLAKAGLTEDTERTRIIIEKPFGHDLESAKELNALLGRIFEEKQIYRIDHYLGKETVQNIMAFRFANAIMEPLWNREHIEHVQISVTENLGVGERTGYYDGSGALRDMIQNHLLQLLCIVAMEPPVRFSAEEVRNRKVDVLRAMRRFTPESVREQAVRGQYASGWIEGQQVPGYR
ncbi:MAG: glucose-6-phosphate dehydrogenase (NADP(+)), partial [Hymenobacter sp.]